MSILKKFLQSVMAIGVIGMPSVAIAQHGPVSRVVIEPVTGDTNNNMPPNERRIVIPGTWAYDKNNKGQENAPSVTNDEETCHSYYIQGLAESGQQDTLIEYLHLLKDNNAFNTITNIDKLRITSRLSADNITIPPMLKTALYSAIDLPPSMQLQWIEANEEYIKKIISDPDMMAAANQWAELTAEAEKTGDLSTLEQITQKAVNIRSSIFGIQAPYVTLEYHDLTDSDKITDGVYNPTKHWIRIHYDHTHKTHAVYDFIKTIQLISHEHDHAVQATMAKSANHYKGGKAVIATLFMEAYADGWYSNANAEYHTYRSSPLEKLAFESSNYTGNMLTEYMETNSIEKSLFRNSLEKMLLKTRQEKQNSYRASVQNNGAFRPLICNT